MIIAMDFDGVLCEDEFPEIGEEDPMMVSKCKMLIKQGHEVILWTCRVGEKLQEAIVWCRDRGIKFTSINDNVPSNIQKHGTNPRKVYADIYVDDRCATYSRDNTLRVLLDVLLKTTGSYRYGKYE